MVTENNKFYGKRFVFGYSVCTYTVYTVIDCILRNCIWVADGGKCIYLIGHFMKSLW